MAYTFPLFKKRPEPLVEKNYDDDDDDIMLIGILDYVTGNFATEM